MDPQELVLTALRALLVYAVMLGVITWCALSWYAATRTRDLDWRGKTRPAAFVLLIVLGGFWW